MTSYSHSRDDIQCKAYNYPPHIAAHLQAHKTRTQSQPAKELQVPIGTSEVPTDPMPIESADLIMVLKDKREWTTAKDKEALAEKMNEKMSVIPGVNLSFE